MIFTREITLDITFNEIKIINIKQYTKDSYLLHVNLTDRGEPFYADKDRLHCYFKMETQDDKHIYIDGIINEDGSVDIPIPEKACLAAGSGIAELEFTELKDETVFATMNLYVNIIASSYNNDLITSSDDFDALHNALFAANKTYDRVMESAENSATAAAKHAKSAQSYAIGGTNFRENEDNDCAKHYSDQAKLYCQLAQDAKDSLGIPLRPMGTRTFANLPALDDIRIGDMYNISDQFTTNDDFAGGSGLTVPAGSNIYKTADNKWDILTGSPVAGVKGSAESSYRTGNVNLTPANIGAINKNGDTMSVGSLKFDNVARVEFLPNASGTYAKGNFFTDRDGNILGGIGMYGANGQFSHIYAAIGTENPWSYIDGLAITNDSFRWKNSNVVTEASGTAYKAVRDGDGNVIANSYITKGNVDREDFNNIKEPGIYRVAIPYNNAPISTVSYFSLIVAQTYLNGTCHQIALPAGSAEIYVRAHSNSTWTPWQKVLTTSNF